MNKFFNILLGITVVLFLLLAVLLLVSSSRIPGFKLDARSVLTGSMVPTIPVGSIVFIYPTNSYKVGDVVTYKRVNSSLETPITHRIIAAGDDEKGNTTFTTKGDANAYQDMPDIHEDEVLGEVVLHLPYIGKLLEIVKTPLGFAGLIIIPAVLVIVDEIKKIIGYTRRNKDEEISDTGAKEEI